MSLDQFTNFIALLQLGLLAKLFLLVLALFYFIFTAIVYRQISLMTQILDSRVSPLIKLLALVQIFSAAFLFFLTIFLA